MRIFRLEGDDFSNAKLVIAQETNLELESHLEDWLENSPWALVQDELILWIDRQPSARDEDGTIFPDLLGVDAEGNLVIVEFKRERTPRDVVAQLLEYAAWADKLSEEQIQEIAETYFETRDEFKGKQFYDAFKDVFDISDTDEVPPLNRNLRLYIVAGNIPARVARVCRFLRTTQGMDINCINISIYQTEESDEVIVSMEIKVGNENAIASKTQRQPTNSQTPQWTGDKPVKQVVWEAAQELTGRNTDIEFAIKDLKPIIEKKYPEFKMSNVSPEIRADCVNNPKRHEHYSGNKNRYWQIPTGKYRLYDPEKDRIESNEDVNQAESVTENST